MLVIRRFVHVPTQAPAAAAAPPSAPIMTQEATQAKKLGVGIGVPLGVLVLCLGGCLIYLILDRRTRKRAALNFRKGGDQSQVLLAHVDAGRSCLRC